MQILSRVRAWEIGDIGDMGKMATMQHILPFLGVMEVKFKFEDKFYTVN